MKEHKLVHESLGDFLLEKKSIKTSNLNKKELEVLKYLLGKENTEINESLLLEGLKWSDFYSRFKRSLSKGLITTTLLLTLLNTNAFSATQMSQLKNDAQKAGIEMTTTTEKSGYIVDKIKTPEDFVNFASKITVDHADTLKTQFGDDVIKHFSDLAAKDTTWANAITKSKKVVTNNLRKDKEYVLNYAANAKQIGKKLGYEHNKTIIKYGDIEKVKQDLANNGVAEKDRVFISAPSSENDGEKNQKIYDIITIFSSIK